MDETSLNSSAFKFVQLLEIVKEEKKQPKESKESSQDHLQFVDLTDKVIESPFIERELNHDLSMSKLKVSVDKTSYEFSKPNYKEFQRFIRDIHSLDFFNGTVSFSFLEEKTFLWVVEVLSSGKANSNLLPFLKTEVENVIEPLTYYFHVVNLHIFSPFKIGQVEMTYFTEEYFDKFWDGFEKKDEVSKEDFDRLYRKYQGMVFATYKVSAEPKRGEEIAFNECCKAIDVLKCFTTTNIFPSRKCYMDLSDRLNVNFQSDSLARPDSEEFELRISFSAKNDPFVINKELFEELQKLGFKQLSDFISFKPTSELDELISQSISLYSYCISTFDLHLRVTQLITIFESILLEHDRKYKMEAMVKKRIGKLMPLNNLRYLTNLEVLFTDMYQIRHKMIHKARRLHIDMEQLREFQVTAIEMIKTLCQLRTSITNKEELISHLEESA